MKVRNLWEEIDWLVSHWDNVPDEFKDNIKHGERLQSVNEDGHIVILLVDRQKPSVSRSYDFDEERFGVNRYGQIIWGFDSGCSCPSPWDDSYPKCYSVAKTWKQFVIDTKSLAEGEGYHDFFDYGWKAEALKRITEIKSKMRGVKS